MNDNGEKSRQLGEKGDGKNRASSEKCDNGKKSSLLGSIWTRIPEALASPSLQRLENTIPIFKAELDALEKSSTAGCGGAGGLVWSNQAWELLCEAEKAVKARNAERGWRCLKAADRFTWQGLATAAPDLLQAKVEAIANEAEDEKKGVAKWRRESIKKLLKDKEGQLILVKDKEEEGKLILVNNMDGELIPFNNKDGKLILVNDKDGKPILVNDKDSKLTLVNDKDGKLIPVHDKDGKLIQVNAKDGKLILVNAKEESKLIQANCQHVYRMIEAKRLLDEHYDNVYQKLAILKTRLTVLCYLGLAFLILWFVVTPPVPLVMASSDRADAFAVLSTDPAKFWFTVVLAGILGALLSAFTSAIGTDPKQSSIPSELSTQTITAARLVVAALSAIAITLFLSSGILSFEQQNYSLLIAVAIVSGFSDRLLLSAIEKVTKPA